MILVGLLVATIGIVVAIASAVIGHDSSVLIHTFFETKKGAASPDPVSSPSSSAIRQAPFGLSMNGCGLLPS